MMSQEILSKVIQFSQRPAIFERGTGNIWTEPYLAQQMLKAHLIGKMRDCWQHT